MKLPKLFCGLIILLSGMAGAVANTPDTYSFTLKNGMKVIVKEDARAPVVSHTIWYKTGSMDEQSARTGVAHVLEHMMFKGTRRYKQGEFNKIVAAAGGQDNAFTSHDQTVYFQKIPKNSLEQMMKLEADRMQHVVFDEASFKKEMQVIMEERRWRLDDQPMSQVGEALYATAFVAHPYRWPIIGWMSDLENMKMSDAREWYRRWYVPNNATLIVVGDVKAQQVKKWAQKHFEKIPARPLVATRPQTEPEQRGIRRVNVKAPAENPVIVMAYKVPVLRDVDKDTEVYALDVLSAVLDGYDNARLTARLVRENRVADTTGVSYDGIGRGPALFVLQGVPAKGKTVAEVETALRTEMSRIAKEGISETELKRVKAQLISSQIYKRDSVFGQAMEIGMFEMAGIPHAKINQVIEKLKAVTPEQVQAVAKKYFNDDTLTVVTLTPLPFEAGKKSRRPQDLRH